MNVLRYLFAGVLLVSALLAVPVSAQPTTDAPRPGVQAFPPRDEAAYDQSWTRFRDQLLEAVQKRDRKFVMGIVDPNVRNGIDRPNGHAEFRRQWHVDDEDSPLWRELPRALHLGTAHYGHARMPRSLCAPYVLPYWPKQMDPRNNGAVTARETSMREGPSGASAVIASFGHSIVRVTDWEVADTDPDVKQKWVKISVDAREGYIPEEHIRSPIEHLACFRRSEAGWRLTSFLAAGE